MNLISSRSFTGSRAGLLLAAACALFSPAPAFPEDFSIPDKDSPELAWWRNSMATHEQRIAWWR